MLVFYNGTGAGASAPDHKHFQCVPIEELPLIKKISYHLKRGVNIALPYRILTDSKKIQEIQTQVSLNAYFWKSEDDEILCFAIPRRAHRPKSFFMDPPMRRAVSPGALDMAGIIVTPMEEDFKLLQEEEIEEILREVGFPNE
ncbi:MAG: DUF4922 domain-containing protein [Muribaculaceae bacterium]|nr:DUF4922 domain-containing protein [Muribaculaceae bacterium]